MRCQELAWFIASVQGGACPDAWLACGCRWQTPHAVERDPTIPAICDEMVDRDAGNLYITVQPETEILSEHLESSDILKLLNVLRCMNIWTSVASYRREYLGGHSPIIYDVHVPYSITMAGF